MLMYVASVLGTNTEVCGNSMLGMTFTRRNLVAEANYAFQANIFGMSKIAYISNQHICNAKKHKSRTNYLAFVRSKQFYNIT